MKLKSLLEQAFFFSFAKCVSSTFPLHFLCLITIICAWQSTESITDRKFSRDFIGSAFLLSNNKFSLSFKVVSVSVVIIIYYHICHTWRYFCPSSFVNLYVSLIYGTTTMSIVCLLEVTLAFSLVWICTDFWFTVQPLCV